MAWCIPCDRAPSPCEAPALAAALCSALASRPPPPLPACAWARPAVPAGCPGAVNPSPSPAILYRAATWANSPPRSLSLLLDLRRRPRPLLCVEVGPGGQPDSDLALRPLLLLLLPSPSLLPAESSSESSSSTRPFTDIRGVTPTAAATAGVAPEKLVGSWGDAAPPCPAAAGAAGVGRRLVRERSRARAVARVPGSRAAGGCPGWSRPRALQDSTWGNAWCTASSPGLDLELCTAADHGPTPASAPGVASSAVAPPPPLGVVSWPAGGSPSTLPSTSTAGAGMPSSEPTCVGPLLPSLPLPVSSTSSRVEPTASCPTTPAPEALPRPPSSLLLRPCPLLSSTTCCCSCSCWGGAWGAVLWLRSCASRSSAAAASLAAHAARS
ncbi:hypothetical protein V8C86DRAFT_2584318 [Haematococcus lacustris]